MSACSKPEESQADTSKTPASETVASKAAAPADTASAPAKPPAPDTASVAENKAEQTQLASAAEATDAAKAPADKPSYQLGVHYEKLKTPVKTVTGDKIEIAEIFSYACGHCYRFESVSGPWKKTMPEGAEFVMTPAVFNSRGADMARIFYTAKTLGVLDELHLEIFKGVLGRQIRDQDDLAKLFAEAGVDKKTFDETYDSFGVSSQVQMADSRVRAFGTNATPEIVVNGEYRVTTSMAGGHRQMLDVASYLVEKIKKQRGK